MPTVRSVQPSEIDRAAEIGAIAFNVEADVDEWRGNFHDFVRRQDTNSLLVVEHEGRLVSSMLLIDEEMWLGETKVPARAVAAVATVPEARKLGCAGEMMREATRRMRAWGAATSPMWPFSFVYYRKFGWEIGGECRVATWPRDAALRIAPVGEVSACGPEDKAALAAVWDAVGPRHRCATARVPETWDDIMGPERFGGGPGRHALVCRQDDKPAGYVLARVPDPQEGAETPPVNVAELRALNAGAEAALLAALPDAVPDAARFTAAFPVPHRLRSFAVNPRAFETSLDANFGFRVVSPEAVLRTLSSPEPQEAFRIRVADEVLGDGCWEVRVEDGAACVEPTTREPDITVAVDTFSQIISGYLKPLQAAEAGLLAGGAPAVERFHAGTAGWTAPFRSSLEAG